MTRKKPPASKSAAQRRSRARKSEAKKATAAEIPAWTVGDRVIIKPTAEQPIAKRGKVIGVAGDVLTIRTQGFESREVRFREHQLVRVP